MHRVFAGLLGSLALAGCQPAEAPPPARPGVSEPLAYPVLLIGQSSLDVRESEADLVMIQGSSSLNLPERRLLDSRGRLFAVVRDTVCAGAKPLWLDLGTSARPHYVEVKEQRPQPDWSEIQAIVIEQVQSPSSSWANDPRVVARVQAMRSVEELFAAAREGLRTDG